MYAPNCNAFVSEGSATHINEEQLVKIKNLMNKTLAAGPTFKPVKRSGKPVNYTIDESFPKWQFVVTDHKVEVIVLK